MGNTGSKTSSYINHQEAHSRQEQVRRILEGDVPSTSPPSGHGQDYAHSVQYFSGPPMARAHSEHNIQYINHSQPKHRAHSEHNIQYINQSQPKHRKGLSKRLSGWLRRLGGSHRSLRQGGSQCPGGGSECHRGGLESHRDGSHGQSRPQYPLQPQHRLLSQSDSGLDMDSVSLVRSDTTYQDLGTPSSVRRAGSTDYLGEGNCGLAECTAGGPWGEGNGGSQRRVDHRFKPKPSPPLAANHWTKFRRRPIYGTFRSEPPQNHGDQAKNRSPLHVGHSYPISFDPRDNDQQRRQYHMSAPGHYRRDQNGPFLAKNKYHRQPSGQGTSPLGWADTPPQSPDSRRSSPHPHSPGGTRTPHSPSPSGRSFLPPSPLAMPVSPTNGWNTPRSSSQNLLDTVAESEDSLEIYNSTVDRQVNSPAFQSKSWFVASRHKSASTGCLSQADSGVGQDYVEFEKSIDFDDEGLTLQYQRSNTASYERIPGSYHQPKMEVGTQTGAASLERNGGGHVCSCKPDIIQYHNCTFIVNPKGLQMGDSAQMHYNSLPKEVRDYMKGQDGRECDSQGVVEVEYSVEEIPAGTIV